MALSSRSAALTQYQQNTGYEADLSGAMALRFIEAARFLLASPEESQGTESRVRYSHGQLTRQIEAARAFYQSATGDVVSQTPRSTPRQFSMERFTK